MNATGDIDTLVKDLTSITGDHKLISIIVMYIIGLIVTLGIGSSFATIPSHHYLYHSAHLLVLILWRYRLNWYGKCSW